MANVLVRTNKVSMPKARIILFDSSSGLIVFNTDALIVNSSKQIPISAKEFVQALEDELIQMHTKAFEYLFKSHLENVIDTFLESFTARADKNGYHVEYDNPDPKCFMFGNEFCVVNADLIQSFWEI